MHQLIFVTSTIYCFIYIYFDTILTMYMVIYKLPLLDKHFQNKEKKLDLQMLDKTKRPLANKHTS